MPPEITRGEMRAQAQLATEVSTGPDGRPASQVTTLRSEAPLLLRLTNAKGPDPWADALSAPVHVSVAAGAAGPVGGDQLILDVDVGSDSALVLCDISPTLLLPGPRGHLSRISTRVRVHDGATLVWMPEPLIAAANCRHLNDIRVELAPTARLLMREELILGRHLEEPGTIQQRLNIRRDGRPLYRQDLQIGPDTPGWNSAAVAATHRAVGSVILVEPQRIWPEQSSLLTDSAAALLLPGPALLITALADDSLDLRDALTAGLSELGTWWPSTEPEIVCNPTTQQESRNVCSTTSFAV